MTEISIRHIMADDNKDLEQVAALFGMMYDEMDSYGLFLPLSDGGAEKWIRGISPTLGRMSILAGAFRDQKMLGFAHGNLKFLPDYLGNDLTGMVTHIFVRQEIRRSGVAGMLLAELERWFAAKKVKSIDLQVVHSNERAFSFWEAHGYKLELKQYRKVMP